MKINKTLKKAIFSIGLVFGSIASSAGTASAASICPIWEIRCSLNDNSACLQWVLHCAPDMQITQNSIDSSNHRFTVVFNKKMSAFKNITV